MTFALNWKYGRQSVRRDLIVISADMTHTFSMVRSRIWSLVTSYISYMRKVGSRSNSIMNFSLIYNCKGEKKGMSIPLGP